jgi:hypothetical protein
MRELADGLWHWTAIHPNHGQRVSSYAFAPARALIDPLLPEDGAEALDDLRPELIVLSCRHHWRSSGELVERFGCRVLCNEEGLHEFADGRDVEGFEPGDLLASGVLAVGIDALSPDETAIHIDAGPGALLIADGVIRRDAGELAFVSDFLLGDDPEQVKRDLRGAFQLVLEEGPPFEFVLFAHGEPYLEGGREALAAFVRGSG